MDTNDQNTAPLRLAVLVGSTRPGRRSELVAEWALAAGRTHLGDRAQLDLLDLADFDLPLLDESAPAAIGAYANDHTRRWAQAVDGYDGFVIVTPEYNHAMPAALKNAVDYLFAEWNDKAAGFVTYGLNGGVRAAEQMRLTLAEVKVACVRSQVALGLFTDFDLPDILDPGTLTPAEHHEPVLTRMLDELVEWAGALRRVRGERSA